MTNDFITEYKVRNTLAGVLAYQATAKFWPDLLPNLKRIELLVYLPKLFLQALDLNPAKQY